MPRFSIVIPTRARADTLTYALKTVTGQDYADLEILVHESGDDSETANAVSAAADRRVRHIKTVQPVSMTENWERALRCATGDYVTFIGDDDGMLPDACLAAAKILDRYSTDLLSWRPACYFWPGYVGARHRNLLSLHLRQPHVIQQHNSRVELELFYRFRIDYSRLPMIYNSFVSRALVKRVQHATGGCYFLGSAPDVTSGIVNAFFSENFLVVGRPLSSSGLSHHSTGHRMHFSGDDLSRKQAIAQAFSGSRVEAPPRNLKLLIGAEMLEVKQRLFPNAAPSFHYRNLFWSAVQSLSDIPEEYYSAELLEIRDAAARNGLSIEEWIEPTQGLAPAAPALGIRAVADTLLMDIDCSRLAISNIHEVTRLLGALMPSLETPHLMLPCDPLPSIAPDQNTLLKFCLQGNGLLFLGYGWSEPEPWGVWSLGTSSELVLSFAGNPVERIELRIAGRMLVHARRPRARGRILLNGSGVIDFEATIENPTISLQVSVAPGDLNSELIIGIQIEAPRSPAQDGISSDTRRLGFGLEEITVTCEPS